MTRKDYAAIAEVFRTIEVHGILGGNSHLYADDNTLLGVASALADMFADDNPRFDRERFLAACWVGASV